MTASDRSLLAARMKAEARADRVARIVRSLNSATALVADVLSDIDDDVRWFRIWAGALGAGATCPSQQTRAAVREAIRTRLPPLAEIYRDELEELERQRQVGMEVWKP